MNPSPSLTSKKTPPSSVGGVPQGTYELAHPATWTQRKLFMELEDTELPRVRRRLSEIGVSIEPSGEKDRWILSRPADVSEATITRVLDDFYDEILTPYALQEIVGGGREAFNEVLLQP